LLASDGESSFASKGAEVARGELDDIQSVLGDPTENRFKRWTLLTGKRAAVTGALLGAVFLFLIAVSFVRPYGMRELLNETNAAKMLFSALLSGAILLVSIVVSINSVVLSQEITDIDRQQERISATLDYRSRIEEYLESGVTPARPAEFLPVILYVILEQAQAVKRSAADIQNEELNEALDAFVDHVSADVEQARKTLNRNDSGDLKVLLAGLSYDYSGQLHAARAFQQQYGDEFANDNEALERLTETLTLFGTAHGYFESLYYKRELAELSSRLLFVSLPVIVFSSYVLLALDAQMFPEMRVLGLSPLLLFVSFAYTVALAPYVILTAYVIRASAITLRTLAAGPFMFRSKSKLDSLDLETAGDDLDWDDLELTDDNTTA
jgi:hypothetical protein